MNASHAKYGMIAIAIILIASLFVAGCTTTSTPIEAVSDSGVMKASVTVQTDANGHTQEQNNIMKKYAMDNDPTTIRYVYVIAQTGTVLTKFTVQGKMTSGGKRLTPNTVGQPSGGYLNYAMPVDIAGNQRYTGEVAQDDGTYGSSADYMYGFPFDGSMIQVYTGGATMIISTKPIPIHNGQLQLQYVDETGNAIAA